MESSPAIRLHLCPARLRPDALSFPLLLHPKENHSKWIHALKSDSHLQKKKWLCVIYFIESPLKMMKNAFYFILKALFVLKIFKFLPRLFGHVRRTVWSERFDVTAWLTNNCNTYSPISQEVRTTRQWNLVN